MPVWTCEKLVEASVALRLDAELGVNGAKIHRVNRSTIEQDFETFGGVASVCLQQDLEFVERQKRLLEQKQPIEPILACASTAEGIVNVLIREKDVQTRYPMCHYDPVPKDVGDYTVHVASEYAKKRLV